MKKPEKLAKIMRHKIPRHKTTRYKILWNDILRYTAALCAFALLLFCFAKVPRPVQQDLRPEAVFSGAALAADTVPGLTGAAESCVLADGMTGEILYESNGDRRLPMASTTKIMTALVALEQGTLDDPFTVPPEVCGIEGSSIYLEAGEVLTLRELLYGLMLESGNDAAEAVAVTVGGSVEHFTAMMNEKAKELGLCDTHFDNPHGLSSQQHYTTAKELCALTVYALKNPVFREIVSCKTYTIPERENCRARYFSNHNRLLRSLDICTGVKTGYTLASGRCLVTSAEQEGSRFVAVTLNDRRDFTDHAALLTYAAEHFRTVMAAEPGELVYGVKSAGFPGKTLVLTNPEPVCLTLPKDCDDPIRLSLSVDRTLLETHPETAARLTLEAGPFSRTMFLIPAAA